MVLRRTSHLPHPVSWGREALTGQEALRVVIPPLETSAMATISADSGGIDTSGNSQLSDARVPGLKEATESGDGKGEMSQHGSMAGGENKRALGKPAVAVASRGKAVALAGRNDKLARVPKSPIRMKRKAARKARPRETLVSLAGSPVKSQPVETPVHVHIDNAEVVTLACDASSRASVENVCKAIQEMCYEELQDQVQVLDHQESEVFDYFERTYIGVAFGRNRTRKDTPFPPTLWSCHDHVLDGLPKTNNSVEAWHDSLQQSLGFRHPDPYRLIAALKQEQSLTEQKQAEAGRWIAVSQRAAYAKIAERLQGVLANYSTTPLIAVMLGCRFTCEL
ncbi:hypothetical protein V5799_022322 [Amblyomma americanum]|uniref:Borealin C-terminal domain-containing protein n=1 Tax=Amblyomma americanum TaxID=6943 RepID=A0AAQ4FL78_AMBAM